MSLNRRLFLAMASAAATLDTAGARAADDRPVAESYRKWIVVNSLGGLEDPNEPPVANPGDAAPRVTARVLADARASGVTAINQTIGYVFGEGDPYEQTVRAIAAWDAVISEHSGDLVKVLTTADIHRAKATHKVGIIYGFQNAAMLGDKAERVDWFADRGVRVIQLTYNLANQLGGGSMAPEGQGLTSFGHEVVERLNARRLIVDLAHSGRQICLDAARASRQPVAITHTGCRALIDLPRNKTDEELQLVTSRGGYVGIYFMPFLAKDRNATADDVVAHIEHALTICGEDHVGIGTDGSFTGIDDLNAYLAGLAKLIAARKAAGISAPGERSDIVPFVIELTGPDQLQKLTDKLSARGLRASTIEKVLGLNFLRFAKEVWGT